MEVHLIALLLLIVFVFGWCAIGFSLQEPLLLFMNPKHLEDKNILLLIAHPDDESMFFSPLLTYSSTRQWHMSDRTHILSLSNGGGHHRSQELRSAATNVFSIRKTQIEVINDETCLKDGITLDWESDAIMDYVTQYVVDHSIDIIFTFDGYGISGHPNHCSIYNALQMAINSGTGLNQHLEVYALKSTNVIRKYSGWLEPMIWMIALLPLHWNIGKSDIVLLSAPLKCWEGMTYHASQFVWYRKLFVMFSRYSWINEFQKVTAETHNAECKKRK